MSNITATFRSFKISDVSKLAKSYAAGTASNTELLMLISDSKLTLYWPSTLTDFTVVQKNHFIESTTPYNP